MARYDAVCVCAFRVVFSADSAHDRHNNTVSLCSSDVSHTPIVPRVETIRIPRAGG